MIQYLYFLSVMSLCLCADVFVDIKAPMPRYKYPSQYEGFECRSGYAFMVSLQRYGHHICGGTLVNAHWVLSAAQCGVDLKAVVGARHLTFKGIDCDYHIIHSQFNSASLLNDVQLVHLSIPQYRFDAVRLPLGMVNTENYRLCGYGTVLGWGAKQSYHYQHHSNALMCSEVQSMRLRDCEREHGRILMGNICSAPCNHFIFNGDAGSPFMCGSIQFGIVSWGWGCTTNLPVVYTSTHYFLNFIQSAMNYEIEPTLPPQYVLPEEEVTISQTPPAPQPPPPPPTTFPSHPGVIIATSMSSPLLLNFIPLLIFNILLKILC